MMKTNSFLRISMFAALILCIVAAGCKKPTDGKDGLNGKDGLTGAPGANGSDGLNGQDANAFCKTCHSVANWAAKYDQLAASKHGYDANLADEGDRRDCAMCHSEQGYLECMQTGLDTPAVNHLVGTTWYNSYLGNYSLTCKACHTFHGTLDEADFPNYALNNVAGFPSIYNKAITLDLGGSNICIRCHQNRPNTSNKTSTGGSCNLDTIYLTHPTDSIRITSSRYGGHHGPQAQLVAGVGMGEYEVPGSATYLNSTGHANLICGDCHILSTASNADSTGGHYFKLKNQTTGNENVSKCVTCHTTATNFDVNGVQTAVKAKMVAIENIGLAEGWLIVTPGYTNRYGGHSDGMIIGKDNLTNASTSNYRKTTAKKAAAIFVFKCIMEDYSYGVHNSKYIQALLTNCYEALNQ